MNRGIDPEVIELYRLAGAFLILLAREPDAAPMLEFYSGRVAALLEAARGGPTTSLGLLRGRALKTGR